MASSWGSKLNVSVFGASHGDFVGATVTGIPAGFAPDLQALQAFLLRRAPGRSELASARREGDVPQFTSGLTDGVTDGTPLTVLFQNSNARSADYAALRGIPRPGHADYTAWVKYGSGCDMAGGGPFSGRLTAPLCAAGGIALQLLAKKGIAVSAHISAAAGIADDAFDPLCPDMAVNRKEFPVLSEQAGERMKAAILLAKQQGDSVGGCVECAVTGLPAGLGGPLFEGLESRIAAWAFAIPGVKGVSFGAGFAAAGMRGSEHNDPFSIKDGRVVTASNHAGGILGGISNGMPLVFSCAFKPTPSISLPQRSVDLAAMQPREIAVSGRHDPCIALRAVPVVEAVAALALCDALLEEGKL